MSDYIARPSHDEEAKHSWMSHWMKKSFKPTSLVDNSSMVGQRSGKEVEEIATGSDNPVKNTWDFQNKAVCLPVSTLKLGHECSDKAISLALSLAPADDFESVKKNNLRISKKRAIIPHSYQEVASISHISLHDSNQHAYASAGPAVVSERHLSNDNFMCLGQGGCKYQKFSTFLFREGNMNKEPSLDELSQSDGGCKKKKKKKKKDKKKKNFVPFFLRKQSANVRGQNSSDQRAFCHGWQGGDKVPCSVRNVETMRICTMVNSVDNSLGGPPKISQRAHQFLFTKETCVNISEARQEFRRPGGVKIQPLWTSTTESEEKENTGNPSSICKADSRNESSDETEVMQVEARENPRIMLGKELCPSIKDDAVNANAAPIRFDGSFEIARGKRPVSDIPDMNEAVVGIQPAASSTDRTEPSTPRVHDLNAKQLFPFGEQTWVSTQLVNSPRKDRPLGGLDANSRWIKRLKSSQDSFGVGTKSSSELGEASSNDKFNQFFNRITNSSNEAGLVRKHPYCEELQMVLDENNKVSKLPQITGLGSPWIQRWCRNYPTVPAGNTEPLVICEPNSMKLGEDELSEKQFPSIAAMALMGKAMNGFRPCEFRKRGPVVVWNTHDDDY